jgi:aldehyde:ferredoxin oxidoreductase
MIPKCCNGKVLHVNLTNRNIWEESPSSDFYRAYGGGSAMGLYYILKGLPRNVDPLSPDNILTIFVSVITGLPISGLSRITVNAKSPLTNAIGDSQAGGFFPVRFKAAGYDGIIIYGRSQDPVYLWINEGNVEIRDARHLWGKITGEVEELIKNELGDGKVEIMQIGPAGEGRVKFAAIMNMANRAHGRTGMGAVMGSKNLKAIVVQGTKKMASVDQQKIISMFKEGTRRIPHNPVIESFHVHGTAGDVSAMQAIGGLPTRNFNEGQFEGSDKISGERVTETILVDRDTCFACSVRCKRVVETEFNNHKVIPRYGGPEYESTATLGTYCGVSDIHAISYANQLCNQYGMDTISCGATIAFAMECFENGLLTLEDTGGIDLQFGNSDSMVKIVEMIGKREGFGNILGEGSERVSRYIGKNSENYLITSKGQEIPAHMPHSKKSMGLIYAVNPFGADHESSEHDPSYETDLADKQAQERMAELGLTNLQPYGSFNNEKARMVAITQKIYSALDTFNLCAFVWGIGFQLYGPQETVDMINAGTGWDMTLDELLAVGERRINMMRVFNAREGLTRQNDTLPKKFFEPLQGSGPCAGEHLTQDELEMVKDAYFGFSGWDMTTGNPTDAKLDELNLGWVKYL